MEGMAEEEVGWEAGLGALPAEIWAQIAEQLPTRSMVHLASTCRHLRSVALSEVRSVRVSVPTLSVSARMMVALIAFLRRSCPRLCRLDLSEWDSLDDTTFKRAFQADNGKDDEDDERGGFRGLHDLVLENTSVTDSAMRHLPTSLTALNLTHLGSHLTDRGLKRILQRCPSLTSLHAESTGITNSGLVLIQNAESEFKQLRIPGATLLQPRQQRKFFSIPLPSSLEVLAISYLRIPQIGIPGFLLREISSCTRLREIDIHCEWPTELPFSRIWLSLLHLRSLHFSNFDLKNVRALWFLPDDLESLVFETSNQLPSASTVRLYWPRSLRSIKISMAVPKPNWNLALSREFVVSEFPGTHKIYRYGPAANLVCGRYLAAVPPREQVDEWLAARDGNPQAFKEASMEPEPVAPEMPDEDDDPVSEEDEEAEDYEDDGMLSIGW
jgi:hypothetical protein